jgi:sn-glycerol 3-phosphate transport system substrate-binding protein
VIESYFAGVKDKSKTFEHRMYRIPSVNANDTVGTAIGGAALYMFDKGNETKRNATWQFVKFLCSPDVSAYFYVKSNYFPLNNDALNTKYVKDYLKATPNKKVCLDMLIESASMYKSQEAWMPSYGVFDGMTGDQCMLYFTGKQNIDKTIDNIVKKTDVLLKMYKNANG